MFKEMNILKPFFEYPSRKFHLREIAKLVGVAPATMMTYLNRFEKSGVVNSKRERNLRLFWSNLGNREFFQLKIWYNIDKIHSSGLLDYLNEKLNQPAIFLFGSWASGENTQKSDIDLFIITNSKQNLDLSEFGKKIGTEIQLFVYDYKEFKRLKEKNKELVNNIINGIRLTGFLEVI